MTQIIAEITEAGDLEANWAATTTPIPALKKVFSTDVFYTGTDQPKWKVGDGVQTWSQLDYMPIGTATTPTLQQVLTAGSTLTSNASITGTVQVDIVVSHFDVTTADGYVIIDDSSGTRVGTANGDVDLFFSNVTKELYAYVDNKITWDSPNHYFLGNVYKNGNAVETQNNKGVANGYAELDASGKVPTAQLPAIALTDVFVVNSQAAQLALTAEEGDVAVRTDLNKSYIHNGGSAGTMADWQELLTPTDAVLSVNGFTGAVTLTSTNIAEGTNLYFTNARAVTALTGQSNAIFTNGAGYITSYKTSIQVGWALNTTLAASTTYHFGFLLNVAPQTSSTARRARAPITGFATGFDFTLNLGSASSGEASTLVLHNLTAGTSVTISSAISTSVINNTSVRGFSLAVTDGDQLELRLTTGAFTSNPANTQLTASLIFSNV